MSNDLLLSASRDKTVRSWSRTERNEFTLCNTYLGHGHFVNSLTTVKPNETYPEGFYYYSAISAMRRLTFFLKKKLGLIVSGGSDKLINVYLPSKPTEPLYTLIGHTENVTTMKTTPSGHIVSGSWDK